MAEQNPQSLYDESYYAIGLGLPYRRDEYWMAFFGRIADSIVSSIGPQRVLDAGCALGLLVEQLRLRGVAADGVDISEFAIANAPEAARPYVRVGSVAEPFGQRYDLIVCIEVLEHMSYDEAERAVANFCAHADDVLFSSSPLDYKEATHFNVQPIEYWADLFARQGFVRDVDFDARFLTPWAIRFRRSAEPLHRVLRNYERRFWMFLREVSDLRELVLEQRQRLADQRLDLDAHKTAIRALEQELKDRDAHFRGVEAERTAYIGQLEADLSGKIAHIDQLKATIARLESGRLMRLMRALTRRGAR
jgi:hypothetical protein